MSLPGHVRGFRAKAINALIDELRAVRPVAGPGISARRNGRNGTVISALAAEGAAAAEDIPLAWRVRAAAPVAAEGEGGASATPTEAWEVYEPRWTVGPDSLRLTGTAGNGWVALPSPGTLAVGDVYANLYAPDPNNPSDPVLGVWHSAVGARDAAAWAAVLLGRVALDAGTGAKTWTQLHEGVLHFPPPGDGTALGPLATAEIQGQAKLVQFAGGWTWNAASAAWAFAPANQTPAVVYDAEAVPVALAVGTEDSGGNVTPTAIQRRIAFLLFPQAAKPYMTVAEIPYVSAVSYSEPSSEVTGDSGLGTLDRTAAVRKFLAAGGVTETTDTLLMTVVEDANATDTYEQAGGNGGA